MSDSDISDKASRKTPTSRKSPGLRAPHQEGACAKKVVAVVVHYGDSKRTVRAVLSHREIGVFSEIIVVANDLSPQPEDLKDIRCSWVVPTRNLGFGGACQAGASTSSADIYVFFNPHVIIDRVGAEQCVAAFEAPDVGIAAPYIYHPGTKDPVRDWKYAHCTRTYSRVLRLPIQVPREQGGKACKTVGLELIDNEWATGGIIFCRKDVITNVGWDASYFLGFEDVDISMRARKCGWRVVVVPTALAFHTGESTRTSTSAVYYATRNRLWFARKHHNRVIQALLTLHLLFLLPRSVLADVLKRRWPTYTRPAVKAVMDGWRLRPGNAEVMSAEPLWRNNHVSARRTN